MQIFCKKLPVALFWTFLLALGSLFAGCTDDESSEAELYPQQVLYSLFPNDMSKNDSAAAHLAQGVLLKVHPKGTYKLSFDIDPNYDAPKMQLYRRYLNSSGTGYRYNQVRSLKPEIQSGRYVYTFTCEENSVAFWVPTLVLDNDYFPGKTPNVRFTGSGTFSDHFSLNLIVVGNVEETLVDYTLDELKSKLLSEFRKKYSSVIIDTMYVSFAHEHPSLGRKYPADEPWVAGYSSDDEMLSELGGWPGIENAVDLVLVHYINVENIVGYSSLFSGVMGGGDESTIVLGTYIKTMYGTIETLSMSEIIETALHETGHFFGLRHTTTTSADFQSIYNGYPYSDYSNYEDGIEDTPYCFEFQRRGLLKTAPTDIKTHLSRVNVLLKTPGFSLEDCPDAKNYMFPAVVETGEYDFSEQQLAIIRENLKLFPH